MRLKIAGGGNGGILVVLSLFLILMLVLGPYILVAGSFFATTTGLFSSFLVGLSGFSIGLSWMYEDKSGSKTICLTGVNLLFAAFGFLLDGGLGALIFGVLSAEPNVKAGDLICSNTTD